MELQYINKDKVDWDSGSPLESYLRNLGIKEIDRFLSKPLDSDYENPRGLKNSDFAVAVMHKHFTKGSKIFLMVDSDTDGITSSAIFHNYVKARYPHIEFEFGMHENKEHGIVPALVKDDIGLVVVPDAGSNQHKEMAELSARGIEVLILDHHQVSEEMELPGIVLVNNQLDNYKNRSLSGAGVVYKVIQLYDEVHFGGKYYKGYEDLAALGILADGMNVTTLENNAIIYNGLRNIQNPMLKEFFAYVYKSQNRTSAIPYYDIPAYELEQIKTKKNTIWSITPLINAMIRVGTQEEKADLFKSFIDGDSIELYYSLNRGKPREETITQKVLRECGNAHSRQATAVLKAVESFTKKVEDEGLAANKVIVVKVDNIKLAQTLTGLIAMKLVVKFGKPVLLVRPVEEGGEVVYKGSGRGLKARGFPTFSGLLREIDGVEYAEGHDFAFGVGIKEQNVAKVIDELNERLKDVNFAEEIQVDSVLIDEVSADSLAEFADNLHIFAGGAMPEPIFYFEFTVPAFQIKVQGKNSDSLKITYKNVNFVGFKLEDLIKQYEKDTQTYRSFRIQAIGTPSINEWMGYRNVQVMFSHISIQGLDEVKVLF